MKCANSCWISPARSSAASRSSRPKPPGLKVWLSAFTFALTLGLVALLSIARAVVRKALAMIHSLVATDYVVPPDGGGGLWPCQVKLNPFPLDKPDGSVDLRGTLWVSSRRGDAEGQRYAVLACTVGVGNVVAEVGSSNDDSLNAPEPRRRLGKHTKSLLRGSAQRFSVLRIDEIRWRQKTPEHPSTLASGFWEVAPGLVHGKGIEVATVALEQVYLGQTHAGRRFRFGGPAR